MNSLKSISPFTVSIGTGSQLLLAGIGIFSGGVAAWFITPLYTSGFIADSPERFIIAAFFGLLSLLFFSLLWLLGRVRLEVDERGIADISRKNTRHVEWDDLEYVDLRGSRVWLEGKGRNGGDVRISLPVIVRNSARLFQIAAEHCMRKESDDLQSMEQGVDFPVIKDGTWSLTLILFLFPVAAVLVTLPLEMGIISAIFLVIVLLLVAWRKPRRVAFDRSHLWLEYWHGKAVISYAEISDVRASYKIDLLWPAYPDIVMLITTLSGKRYRIMFGDSHWRTIYRYLCLKAGLLGK